MYRQSEKNLLGSNISSTCPHNIVNFGPLAAEILSGVWGTPATFIRTSFGARSFSVAADKIWNFEYVIVPAPNTFRHHVKTHYLQQAFQSA